MQHGNPVAVDVVSAPFPGFYCPCEPRVHPRAEAVHADTLAWTRRVGLGRPQGDDKYAIVGSVFASLCYPGAPETRLRDVARLSAWLILLDDLTDTTSTAEATGTAGGNLTDRLARLARVAEAPGCALSAGDPLADSFVDIVRGIETWADPTQMRWFREGVRRYFLGLLWEADLVRTDAAVTLNDFLIVRHWASASGLTAAVAAMLADAGDGSLLVRELDTPTVRAATEAAMTALSIDNDRLSHAKTISQGDRQLNVFAIAERQYGISFADAVVTIIALRDRFLHLSVRLREQLWPQASSELRRYLTSLEQLVVGAIGFSEQIDRFRTTKSVAVERTTVPSDDRLEPPDLPSVRWWWDQLDPAPGTTPNAQAPRPDRQYEDRPPLDARDALGGQHAARSGVTAHLSAPPGVTAR